MLSLSKGFVCETKPNWFNFTQQCSSQTKGNFYLWSRVNDKIRFFTTKQTLKLSMYLEQMIETMNGMNEKHSTFCFHTMKY